MAIKRLQFGPKAADDHHAELKWEADVVIAGGAVAGASMTHALAEYGLSSVVLERKLKVPEINRGDVLQPLSLQFLDRWAVYSYIEDMGGFPLYEWNFYNPRIGHLATWNFSSLPCTFNHQTILRHVRIHEALYAAMEPKSDLINAQRGAVVSGVLIDDATDAVVGLTGKQGDRSFEAKGRVVVAADGMRSKLRDFLGIGQEERYTYDHEYLMLTTPRPDVPEMDRKGVQYIGRHGLVVLIPLDGGEEIRVPVQIPLGSLSEWRDLGPSELRHRLVLRAPILEHVDTDVAMDKLAHSYPVHWRHSDAYVRRNVCLIGEAARTVHPTTAQGMNMAILDAEVLAAVIKRCFAKDGVCDDTLNLYERSRRPIAETVMDTSHHQTLHHTACGVWHDIWGARMYRWSEDEAMKRDISMSIAGLKNPTSKDLKILEEAGIAA